MGIEKEEEIVGKTEIEYYNGTNKKVKILNQICVICFKNSSVYAFGQCGHQCIDEKCYRNKSDED